MFWDNLVKICKEVNTTPTAVVNALGISGGSITKWKQGSVPRDTTLLKIADYFGVTVEYLLGKEEKEKPQVFLSHKSGDEERERIKEVLLYLEESGVIEIPGQKEKPAHGGLGEITEKEKQLIELFRRTDEDKRVLVLEMVKAAIKNQ